ncbi:MAG: histidinol dehydrogenase, partial [Phycisphaerales bacterium]|nr:histidinol dehydrogenase [Phycisphaerales bacterium]
MTLLKSVLPSQVEQVIKSVVSDQVLDQARAIVDRVRREGEAGVRAYAMQFCERTPDQPLVLGPDAMRGAYDAMDPIDRAALQRAAERIEHFALAQRDSIKDMTLEVPGGQAGYTVEPVSVAGCYAPAGRYPLPSSVLMTVITARAASCSRVVVASPGANPVTLAAAYIAGADE